jgi:hypothetical protein
MHHFKARLYELTNKTFLCPHSDMKAGDLCIAFHPFNKVDPRGLYAFVVDVDGTTQSVTKRFLKMKDEMLLEWERPQLCTANEEMLLKLKAMRNYIRELKTKSV